MSLDARSHLQARFPLATLRSNASRGRPGARTPAGIGALAALAVLAAPAPAHHFQRVSVDSVGAEGNAMSVASVLSADGRTSAFSSYATNLVAGDTNGFRDVFVRDAATGVTVRVSIASVGGPQADGASYSPSLSADGRFVAFTSEASNLVHGDTNGVADVFVHDRDPDGNGVFDEGNGRTVRVSVDSSGQEAHGPSYGAYSHTISADGRLVVFRSAASDLVAGDGNGASDVFVHDLVSGRTTRVSVDSAGAEANLGSSLATISANGAVVAFQSDATNLVPGDTNGVTDVFTHDLQSGLTARVSLDSSGQQYGTACSAPALSPDGGVIAFRKRSSPGPDNLCMRDTAAGWTQQLTNSYYFISQVWSEEWWSQWSAALGFAALSADGSRVAYVTTEGSAYSYQGRPHSYFSANVTATLWVLDRSSQTLIRLAQHSASDFTTESQALAWAPFYAPAMSDDGAQLGFESDSPSLVAGDTNGVRDAFVCSVVYPVPVGTNYCTAHPNSTGQTASISALGSASASDQTLSLTATNLPPTAFGRFFYGTTAASVPFGDGDLCVGGAVQRFPRTFADGLGVLRELDVFSIPAPVLPLVAGATYHFQAVYRDPAAMQSGFNLTDALTITFTP